MHLGHVVADSRPQEITRELPGVILEITAEPRARAAEALRNLDGPDEVQAFGTRFHVRFSDRPSPETIEGIRRSLHLAGAEIESLREVPPGLEDAFLHLTRESGTSEEAA
jgi:ABC-2 type transport system ATP-binding protein